MVLGAGVIGLGTGARHVEAYFNHPEVEVRGVCDTLPDQTREVAEKYAVPFSTNDYMELVRRDDINVISVASPDHVHAEHVIAALEAGKDVLCEKPMALSIEDCERMIDAADRTGRRLMVGMTCRYSPGFKLAKETIERGDIGELFFVESEYAHDYSHLSGWRKDPAIRREPFLGGACHSVDLLRWIAGEMTEVSAYANHKALADWPVNDCTVAIYKFANGSIGKVFCSIGCKRPYTMRSVFYGTKGTMIADYRSGFVQLYTTSVSDDGNFVTIPVEASRHYVTGEVADFIETIRESRPVVTDAREGAKTVSACLATIESARIGMPVSVRTVF